MDSSTVPYTQFDKRPDRSCFSWIYYVSDFFTQNDIIDSPARVGIFERAQKIYKNLIQLLQRTDSIINEYTKQRHTSLCCSRTEEATWYLQEIEWYNNNRRSIFKGTIEISNIYQNAIDSDDLFLQTDLVPFLDQIERDMEIWKQKRTEQLEFERGLQRAFDIRRSKTKNNSKSKNNRKKVSFPSDSEYTDFSEFDH